MPTPAIYTKNPQFIKSYDYIDSAGGFGIKTFYPTSCSLSGSGIVYILSPTTLAADTLSGCYVNNNSGLVNFDVSFNVPLMTSNADATIEYMMNIGASTAGFIMFNLYHVRGATTTLLGSATTQSTSAGGTQAFYKKTHKINIPSKQFVINDILRLSVEAKMTSGSNNVNMWVDGSGMKTATETNTGGTINSQAKLNIPIKLTDL